MNKLEITYMIIFSPTFCTDVDIKSAKCYEINLMELRVQDSNCWKHHQINMKYFINEQNVQNFVKWQPFDFWICLGFLSIRISNSTSKHNLLQVWTNLKMHLCIIFFCHILCWCWDKISKFLWNKFKYGKNMVNGRWDYKSLIAKNNQISWNI